MQQEKFSLTSDAYSDHQRKILHDLLETNDFADVTLVCDDLKQIKAHRNILSACSPVFKTMLHIETNNSHPVIYLRGIQYTEMESIIQYIYKGKATFLQERLSDLLSTAKSLQIRELAKSVKDDQHESQDEDVLQKKEDQLMHAMKSANELEHPDEKTITAIKPEFLDQDVAVYPCNQCHFETKALKYLKQHMKTQHGDKHFCDKCDYEANDSRNLSKHIKIMHQGFSKNTFACKYCDYQAQERSHLRVHIGKHEGITYDCTHCDYKATEPGSLRRHFRAKHEGVKYDCNQCNYQSGYQHELKIHIQSKHEGLLYPCDQCDYKASKYCNLNQHVKTCHDSVNELPLDTVANDQLQDDEAAATLSQYEEVLQNKEDLLIETQFETDEKTFKSMKQEFHDQNGELYSCRQCPFETTTLKYLKEHNKTQHGETKYICNQCDFETDRHNRLRMHIGKHEGVTYDCTHCDYKATEPSSLRRHAKAKHEGVKYDCNQCDFQSGYRADLTIHIKSKHEGLGVSHSSLCL